MIDKDFPEDRIKLRGQNLHMNQTMSITCPYCEDDWVEQGQPAFWKPEKSMSITRAPNGVLYCCHRVTCDKKGIAYSPYAPMSISKAEHTKFKPMTYPHDTICLTKLQEKYLYSKFYLTALMIYDAKIRYAPATNTFVLPILNARGKIIGVVDRDFTGTRTPKTLNYYFEDEPSLYFSPRWGGFKSTTCVIVEDIISANRAGVFGPSCSLLGTAFSKEKIKVLSTFFTRIVLALDNDATQKALDIQKKYGGMFESFRVMYLREDLKNLPPSDVRALIHQFTS